MASLFLWAIIMNLTKGIRMEGVYPINPNNSPDEPKPHLVIMGKFALALMGTLFTVFLVNKMVGKKENKEE